MRAICFIFSFVLAGCAAGNGTPLITRPAQLDAHVGELVTIRGEVTNTKIPTIIGVDVRSDEPDLRGRMAEATGVLERWTVTQQELDAAFEEAGIFATRGPGVYYRLKAPGSNDAVQVRPLQE